MSNEIEFRTHCQCGHKLDDPKDHLNNWGSWKCRKCGWAYCQDCGSVLDANDECMTYREMQDDDQASGSPAKSFS